MCMEIPTWLEHACTLMHLLKIYRKHTPMHTHTFAFLFSDVHTHLHTAVHMDTLVITGALCVHTHTHWGLPF